MDNDRIAGSAKDFAGKAESTVGDMTGDSKTEASGRMREAAGTVQNDSRNDGGLGTFSGGTDRIDFTAPSGAAMRGQDAFGVNWPAAGQCYVSAWVVAI